MRKIRSLVAIFAVMMIMIIPGFGEGNVAVEKVIFKNLSSSAEYPTLGGVRFFNGQNMIDSGNALSAGKTVGETEFFTATSSTSYAGTDVRYKLTNALDINKPQQPSNYSDGAYWIAARYSEDQWFEVGFKTATELTKIEFVPLPGNHSNHSTTEPFVIEVIYSNGFNQSYDIVPTTTRNEIQTVDLNSIAIPDVPTDLKAKVVNETIDLDWTAVSGSDSYNLYRTVSGGSIELIASDLVETIFSDQTISIGVQYQYVVTAVANGVEGGQSQPVVIGIPEPTAPSTPLNLTATLLNESVRLNWDVVDLAESYNVYRMLASGGASSILAEGAIDSSFIDTTAAVGIDYLYYVTAVGNSLESGQSNQVSAMIPEPVVNNLILKLYLDNHQIKEYEFNSNELSHFVDWFEGASDGTEDPYYVFTKTYAIGPYDSVKEYIVFDKIVYFEVSEY